MYIGREIGSGVCMYMHVHMYFVCVSYYYMYVHVYTVFVSLCRYSGSDHHQNSEERHRTIQQGRRNGQFPTIDASLFHNNNNICKGGLFWRYM